LQRDQADGLQALEHGGDLRDRQPPELQLLPRGDVGQAAAVLVGQRAERAELDGAAEPVRNADTHHEVPGSVLAPEHAPPFEALEIALGNGGHPELGEARNVRADVEAVFLRLDLLDLVQPAPPVADNKKGRLPVIGKAPLPSRRAPGVGRVL